MRSRDVSVGELDRRQERLVGDEHIVMTLEALLARLQNLDRLHLAELADDDLLEAALERGVALDPSLVLVARRRADDAKVAANERGLEHVRRVHRGADRGALPDQIVQLVDEQDHVAGRGRLGDDDANSLLVLAAVGRAGEERDVIERQEPDLPQRRAERCRAAIRWASPSAIAVLPTPAGPTSVGLFFP